MLMDEWCAFLKRAEEEAGTELGKSETATTLPRCHARAAILLRCRPIAVVRRRQAEPPRHRATALPRHYHYATTTPTATPLRALPGEALAVNLDSAATTQAAKKKKKKGWDASKLEKSGIPTIKRRASEAKSGQCPCRATHTVHFEVEARSLALPRPVLRTER